MNKLVCKVDGERMIALESLGKRTLRDGQEIEVNDAQMNEPEIQFLLKKGLLVKLNDKGTALVEAEGPKTLLKCNLSPERLLTLDSIKGSVSGGKVIEIDTRDLSNMDIQMCLKNGFLEKLEIVETEEVEEVQEEVEVESIKDPESRDVVFLNEDENKESDFEDVTFDEISQDGSKEKQPNSRVGDDMRGLFLNIGKQVMEENSEPEVEEKPKKRGRGRPKKEKVEDINPKPKRKRGRPRKEKAAEPAKPKRKRGRPRKNKVEK
jgi:hypothetical protein